MAYEDIIGYIVQGLCTGFGVAIGTWVYKKYLEPTLEKNHERLAKIPIPVPKTSADKGYIAHDTTEQRNIFEPQGPKW